MTWAAVQPASVRRTLFVEDGLAAVQAWEDEHGDLTDEELALPEMQISGDPPESDAQQLKYLWHTLLALGSDAAPTT